MSNFLISILFLSLFLQNNAEKLVNKTDFNFCKLTQFGTEYRGPVGMTAGDIRCQSWYGEDQIHEVDSTIRDRDFPEKSMRLAKNYCRNPTTDPKGPWCYTMDSTLIDDDCGIPLCNFGECRISGIGSEYGGNRSISSSGRKCKSWDKRRKILGGGKTEKFPNANFPDTLRSKAKNFCRNPDNDPKGPWCWTEEENFELVEKDLCDVPFCDDRDCLIYTKNSTVYSTMTRMNDTIGNFTFWIKLWNPGDEIEGEARLLLSHVSVPTSSQKIAQEWKAGTEILISNQGSGQIYPNDDEVDLEPTPNILLGSKWTGITVTWAEGFISVNLLESTKPIFLDEYIKNNTISSLFENNFLHYGLLGTGVLWSTEICQESCQVHTTFGLEFNYVWPLQQTNTTWDIHFYVRANKGIALKLYSSPGSFYPCFTLTIGDNGAIILTYQSSEKTGKEHLKDAPSANLLDYWKWNEFTLNIFGPHMRLFSRRYYGNEEVLYAKEHLFTTLRWFSVGSDDVIAHWTFFCAPEVADAIEAPSPPNCIANSRDFRYNGSQWTTVQDTPCIPWISDEIPEIEKQMVLFPDNSILKSINKCRNPSKDPMGPYCYTYSLSTLEISKSFCSIRSCRSSECRMAGTANDYIGTLSITRSGRTCAPWISNLDHHESAKSHNQSTKLSTASSVVAPRTILNKKKSLLQQAHEAIDYDENNEIKMINGISSFMKHDNLLKKSIPKTQDKKLIDKKDENNNNNKPFHHVNPEYLNDTLYPELSAKNASNYCRDPSRNIAGTWCYTTDPLVPQDLCDVRDCEKSDECIYLVRGSGVGRRLYILPEHRSEGLHFALKAWEPDHPDSITFVFLADDGLKSRYILKIGASNNEKVLLYYESEEKAIELVKKKTLPHLLYLGKWSSFVVKISRGKIQVFYEGSPSPLFDWEHPELHEAFLPIYYYYTSEAGYTIGVSFDCQSGCPIEIVNTEKFNRIIPISTWNKDGHFNTKRLQLMIRGHGTVLIPLLLFPATPGYYALTIGEMGQWIFFLKNTNPKVKIFHKEKVNNTKLLFDQNSWTNFTITWFNNKISVYWNGTLAFNYEHTSPLLFYFFSLAVDKGGSVTWTANCLPPDIDGEAEDGGWSEWGPWACSASCNGGVGTRQRKCNNPVPNVKGEPCIGPSIMTGICNTILCGDITLDTVNLIKSRIRNNFTSLIIEEGKSIQISADTDVIDLVTYESPDAEIEWSHNGIFMYLENDRIEIENHSIVINRAEVNDSGVYTITLHRVDETHMIMKLVSLVVLPVRTDVTLRETMPMTVACHCVILGYLYSDLKIHWTINNKMWKNYGSTLPLSVNIDHVPGLNSSHRGLWECHVKQEDLNFHWTTNAILINVIGPSNWKTHLMEDELTRPIFGWMPNENFVAIIAPIIFLALAATIIISTIFIIRFKDSLKRIVMAKKVPKKMENSKELPLLVTTTQTPRKVFEKFQKLSIKKSKIKIVNEESEALLSNNIKSS